MRESVKRRVWHACAYAVADKKTPVNSYHAMIWMRMRTASEYGGTAVLVNSPRDRCTVPVRIQHQYSNSYAEAGNDIFKQLQLSEQKFSRRTRRHLASIGG
ncbi:unnamed protein product, partial [Ectocarpus sp. 12 AP-2014]